MQLYNYAIQRTYFLFFEHGNRDLNTAFIKYLSLNIGMAGIVLIAIPKPMSGDELTFKQTNTKV